MKPVAVVIPLYKNDLNANEMKSLAQCYKILGHYDIVFVCPKSMESQSFQKDNQSKGHFLFLENIHFLSIESYNHLMLSSWFYKRFINYEYILIHQLDCYVFKDELMYWVNQKYSYIGAPWFKGNSGNYSNIEFNGVGNGGFSLRKVSDCIRILKSYKKVNSSQIVKSDQIVKSNIVFFMRRLKLLITGYSFRTIKNNVAVNEDKIFGNAPERFDFFVIPPAEIAARFAFEKQPRFLFEITKGKLPFGCHAFMRNDYEFYDKYIL